MYGPMLPWIQSWDKIMEITFVLVKEKIGSFFVIRQCIVDFFFVFIVFPDRTDYHNSSKGMGSFERVCICQSTAYIQKCH